MGLPRWVPFLVAPRRRCCHLPHRQSCQRRGRDSDPFLGGSLFQELGNPRAHVECSWGCSRGGVCAQKQSAFPGEFAGRAWCSKPSVDPSVGSGGSQASATKSVGYSFSSDPWHPCGKVVLTHAQDPDLEARGSGPGNIAKHRDSPSKVESCPSHLLIICDQ